MPNPLDNPQPQMDQINDTPSNNRRPRLQLTESPNHPLITKDDFEYMRTLIDELINIFENPQDSNLEWKKAIIEVARDKGYGLPTRKEPTGLGVVKSSFKCANGMVATFGFDFKQIPELNGPYTKELHELIRMNSDERTQLIGF
jgi:hypothetical protein